MSKQALPTDGDVKCSQKTVKSAIFFEQSSMACELCASLSVIPAHYAPELSFYTCCTGTHTPMGISLPKPNSNHHK